jgi:hypothetical protein
MALEEPPGCQILRACIIRSVTESMVATFICETLPCLAARDEHVSQLRAPARTKLHISSNRRDRKKRNKQLRQIFALRARYGIWWDCARFLCSVLASVPAATTLLIAFTLIAVHAWSFFWITLSSLLGLWWHRFYESMIAAHIVRWCISTFFVETTAAVSVATGVPTSLLIQGCYLLLHPGTGFSAAWMSFCFASVLWKLNWHLESVLACRCLSAVQIAGVVPNSTAFVIPLLAAWQQPLFPPALVQHVAEQNEETALQAAHQANPRMLAAAARLQVFNAMLQERFAGLHLTAETTPGDGYCLAYCLAKTCGVKCAEPQEDQLEAQAVYICMMEALIAKIKTDPNYSPSLAMEAEDTISGIRVLQDIPAYVAKLSHFAPPCLYVAAKLEVALQKRQVLDTAQFADVPETLAMLDHLGMSMVCISMNPDHRANVLLPPGKPMSDEEVVNWLMQERASEALVVMHWAEIHYQHYAHVVVEGVDGSRQTARKKHALQDMRMQSPLLAQWLKDDRARYRELVLEHVRVLWHEEAALHGLITNPWQLRRADLEHKFRASELRLGRVELAGTTALTQDIPEGSAHEVATVCSLVEQFVAAGFPWLSAAIRQDYEFFMKLCQSRLHPRQLYEEVSLTAQERQDIRDYWLFVSGYDVNLLQTCVLDSQPLCPNENVLFRGMQMAESSCEQFRDAMHCNFWIETSNVFAMPVSCSTCLAAALRFAWDRVANVYTLSMHRQGYFTEHEPEKFPCLLVLLGVPHVDVARLGSTFTNNEFEAWPRSKEVKFKQAGSTGLERVLDEDSVKVIRENETLGLRVVVLQQAQFQVCLIDGSGADPETAERDVGVRPCLPQVHLHIAQFLAEVADP